jgi:hypothetical protein
MVRQMRLTHIWFLLLAAAVWHICTPERAFAQSAAQPSVTCTVGSQLFNNPYVLRIRCLEHVTQAEFGDEDQQVGPVTLTTLDEKGAPVSQVRTGKIMAEIVQWIYVKIPETDIRPNTAYRVSLTSANGSYVTFVDQTTRISQTTFPFNTNVTDVTCSAPSYRVISPQLLGIECLEQLSVFSVGKSPGALALQDKSGASPPPLPSPLPSALPPPWVHTGGIEATQDNWILVHIPEGALLESNATYSVTLVGFNGNKVGFVDPATQKSQGSFSFNTNETDTFTSFIVDSASGNRSMSREYQLSSNIGIQSTSKPEQTEPCRLLYEDASQRKGSTDSVSDVKRAADEKKALNAGCKYENGITQNPNDSLTRNLAGVGQVLVVLREIPGDSFSNLELPIGIDGLLDVFGKPLKIDPKSKFKTQKAPTSKDASQYYINLNYAAGVGSKPAWAADTKIAPQVGRLEKGFQFSPSFTSDIGHNSISGVTYTDTIDFGLSASRIFINPASSVREISFTPGITYETDREFDRDNLLGTTDVRFVFPHLWNLQANRQIAEFITAHKTNPNLTPDQVPVPHYGYELDLHVGTETGGDLADTTVKATAGGAKATLPTYTIVRFVPEVHAQLQLAQGSWGFAFEFTGTERYLATTENTIIQLSNNSLLLEHLTGWKPYGVLSATIKPDQTGHLAISITYKDGYAPPKFQRINAVQVGVVLMY